MTESSFKELQLQQQQSGKSLKCFIKDLGVASSTWSYWRKKYERQEASHDLAPISIKVSGRQAKAAFESNAPGGTTLLFPNGLRAHFGAGSEGILTDMLNKILSAHVLP